MTLLLAAGRVYALRIAANWTTIVKMQSSPVNDIQTCGLPCVTESVTRLKAPVVDAQAHGRVMSNRICYAVS